MQELSLVSVWNGGLYLLFVSFAWPRPLTNAAGVKLGREVQDSPIDEGNARSTESKYGEVEMPICSYQGRRAVRNVRTLQLIAGHANIQTTMRYLHPSQDDIANALLSCDNNSSDVVKETEQSSAGDGMLSCVQSIWEC